MTKTIPSIAAGVLAAIAMICAVSARAQEQPMHPVQKQACLAPAAWYTLAGDQPRTAPARELLADMASRDIVLLGEQHDDADHHQWQLQALAALHVLRPQMAIGFESFPRRVQAVLDRWIAGELTVTQFFEQTGWEKIWNFPPELYLPLFQFARINRIPMVALNVERAPASNAYQDYLFEVFKAHPRRRAGETGTPDRNDSAFRFFVESQTTWDRAMAEALARRMDAGPGALRLLVVGIMGSGHVRNGYGVPHQLRDLGVSNIAALLPVDPRQDCESITTGFADGVYAMPEIPRDKLPPPRLGVRLEEIEGSVTLAAVSPGSLAEQTGLRPGDRIVSIAGIPVVKSVSVVSAIRMQPDGTWLPMQIQRGTETLDVVIKFPPRK
ncbi:MAG: ChaN family lipoprotein [Betaproteobacteria bacterium]|nr:ChaN family lipoprotein [Betaproteobacteria bacterium]